MKILVVGLVKNPHLERLRHEGNKRGHDVVGCYTTELTVFSDNSGFYPTLRGKNLSDYDLIYLWVARKKRWEWNAVLNYLYQNFGTIIVNKIIVDPGNFNPSEVSNIYLLSKANLDFPKTSVMLSAKSIMSQIKKFSFPLVVKSASSRKGKGVFKVNSFARLYRVARKIEKAGEVIVLREFIPNDGDIRVFTIGYKAVSAMKRIPAKGEFRSNINQGAVGKKLELKNYSEIKKIAENASKALSIEIAGVDIIVDKKSGKPYILEVNPGPQFLGSEKYTKVNISLEIIKYFEYLYKLKKLKRLDKLKK